MPKRLSPHQHHCCQPHGHLKPVNSRMVNYAVSADTGACRGLAFVSVPAVSMPCANTATLASVTRLMVPFGVALEHHAADDGAVVDAAAGDFHNPDLRG